MSIDDILDSFVTIIKKLLGYGYYPEIEAKYQEKMNSQFYIGALIILSTARGSPCMVSKTILQFGNFFLISEARSTPFSILNFI